MYRHLFRQWNDSWSWFSPSGIIPVILIWVPYTELRLFYQIWRVCNRSEEKTFFYFITLFSIPSFVAIFVGNRELALIWKGATQGRFHQSLFAIGPVVSEEKIKM
jgi:hypothetical protein